MNSNPADHEKEKRLRLEVWRLEQRIRCDWCGEANPSPRRYCPACGHRANLPAEGCDCARCEIAI